MGELDLREGGRLTRAVVAALVSLVRTVACAPAFNSLTCYAFRGKRYRVYINYCYNSFCACRS
jgi:hypothetical protein